MVALVPRAYFVVRNETDVPGVARRLEDEMVVSLSGPSPPAEIQTLSFIHEPGSQP